MSTKLDQNRGFYIDIDSLLDTRLAVLKILDPNLALTLIENERYHYRIIDSFGYITNTIFNQYYKRRNNTVLKQATVTNIVDILFSEIVTLKTKPGFYNPLKPIPIHINIFPYSLEEKEKENIIKVMYNILVIDNIEITITDRSFDRISPIYVDNNYICLFMYNGLKWLEYHVLTKSLLSRNLPTTRLYVPALMEKPIIMNQLKEYDRLFNDTIQTSSFLIDLVMLTADHFSIKLKKEKE